MNTDSLSDLEITRLCAEAMGLKWIPNINSRAFPEHLQEGWVDQQGIQFPFRPLTDDAQAMALVKKFGVTIGNNGLGKWIVEWWPAHQSLYPAHDADGTDLNRAICECVAKMQAAK